MKVTPTPLAGLLVLEPQVFGDARGFFLESFNARRFAQAVGAQVQFVQDNHSRSARGTLRGLHYQLGSPQGKLVRITRGRAWDVAVDLRRGSPTLGQWFGLELSEANHLQLWIPVGFAHGFVALEDDTDFLYKTTDYYNLTAEHCIAWNDAQLAIAWPLSEVGVPKLSAKDQNGVSWADAHLMDGGA